MGLEPTTSAVTGRRSNQLSQRAMFAGQQIPARASELCSSCHRGCAARAYHTLKTAYREKPQALQSLMRSSPRPISNSQLHALLRFHLCPIYLVVFKGSYFFKRMGYLILRGASRLDAFSVYPVRTQLLGHALDRTTDTPEVRPPRSSRTKGSSSQISCARAG